jgi:hypothetical protein
LIQYEKRCLWYIYYYIISSTVLLSIHQKNLLLVPNPKIKLDTFFFATYFKRSYKCSCKKKISFIHLLLFIFWKSIISLLILIILDLFPLKLEISVSQFTRSIKKGFVFFLSFCELGTRYFVTKYSFFFRELFLLTVDCYSIVSSFVKSWMWESAFNVVEIMVFFSFILLFFVFLNESEKNIYFDDLLVWIDKKRKTLFLWEKAIRTKIVGVFLLTMTCSEIGVKLSIDPMTTNKLVHM